MLGFFHFKLFPDRDQRFGRERQLDELIQVLIIILATNDASELVDLFYDQPDVMKTLESYFCTNL